MLDELDIRKRAWSQLRHHAHELLAGGYQRLTPAELTDSEEPEITGELCKAIEAFMASPEAPAWVDHYALRDDPKLNVPGRLGDARPRIDIEVERVQRGERPKFRFEAKRLGRKHTVGTYLGSAGLGAFLDGYYPLTLPEAGMLGYCQEQDSVHWADLLAAQLALKKKAHRQVPADRLTAQPLALGLDTWRSMHFSSRQEALTIWHTFLRFC